MVNPSSIPLPPPAPLLLHSINWGVPSNLWPLEYKSSGKKDSKYSKPIEALNYYTGKNRILRAIFYPNEIETVNAISISLFFDLKNVFCSSIKDFLKHKVTCGFIQNRQARKLRKLMLSFR